MPNSIWGNTDAVTDKPLFPSERQVRPFTTLVTNGAVSSGNTVVFAGVGAATAANVGIVAGMSAYATNLSITGERDFYVSNNVVKSVSGNTVIFTNNVMGTIATGTSVDFGVPITYNNTVELNYNTDTVLVTPTRLANATFGGSTNHATAHQGWVHVVTGTGGRAGRVQAETLVALANPVASNTLSGNTSTSSTYYAGL